MPVLELSPIIVPNLTLLVSISFPLTKVDIVFLSCLRLAVIVPAPRLQFDPIIGDNSKTGIGTLIYPGRKIYPKKTTLPGERV